MKNILFIIFYLGFEVVKAASLYPILDIPTELQKNAKAVVREDVGFFDVKSPSEATFKVRMAVTIFKEGHPYDVFPLYYSKNSKIKNVRARYYDALGNLVRKVEKDEIRDIAVAGSGTLYSDTRCKYVENNYGVLPYTFELEYEEQYSAIQSYPNWTFQRFNTAVQKSEFTISLPDDIEINYRVFNSKIEENKTKEKNRTTYRWAMENIGAIVSEPFSPSAQKVLPYLAISPSKFGVDGLEGSMKDWASFGQFLYNLDKNLDDVSPEFSSIIKEMTAHCKNDAEKIDTLYHYMQRNMRYVSVQIGIGGWKPFDAVYVEKNKFGDCKALSNFMKAMLKSVGISSNLVIVSAGEEDYNIIDPNFCFPNANHMILYVPSEKMWLECTSDQAPTGYLGGFTQGRSVLLITEDGGKVVNTPALDTLSNMLINKSNIKLLADGAAVLNSNTSLRGTLQDDIRMHIKNLSKEDFQKKFREKQKVSNFKLENLETIVDNKKPEVNLNYILNIEKYASKAGNRLFFPLNVHHFFNDTPTPTDNRHLPIEVGNAGYVENIEYVFTIPDGYVVENIAGAKTELHSKYGDYSSDIEKKGDNTIVFKRKLTIKPVKEEASKFNEFRDFYKKMQQADSAKVILKSI